MGFSLQCGKNNVHRRHFLVGMAFFFVNKVEYRENYTLIDLPVHGAQIEPSLIFVACFNRELRMMDYLSTCNLFPIFLLYKSSLSLFQPSSVITPRPLITKS